MKQEGMFCPKKKKNKNLNIYEITWQTIAI